jgi:hypothetical protein
LELSERLTEASLNRLNIRLAQDALAAQALALLADRSAFLDPPNGPDGSAGLAVGYVDAHAPNALQFVPLLRGRIVCEAAKPRVRRMQILNMRCVISISFLA